MCCCAPFLKIHAGQAMCAIPLASQVMKIVIQATLIVLCAWEILSSVMYDTVQHYDVINCNASLCRAMDGNSCSARIQQILSL